MESLPGSPSATPMLAVLVNISPATGTRSPTIASNRLASCSASAADIGEEGMTTNSSPPRRATTPASSTPRCSRSAITRMNQSPTL